MMMHCYVLCIASVNYVNRLLYNSVVVVIMTIIGQETSVDHVHYNTYINILVKK